MVSSLVTRWRQALQAIKHDRRGSTLVELLVVTALFTIVGGLTIGFFLSILTGRAKVAANIEAQAQARRAMMRIAYAVRNARSFEVTSDYGVNLATSASNSMDLDMEDPTIDPTVISVSGGVLRMQQGGGSVLNLTSNDVEVTNLTFTNRSTANGRSRQVRMVLTIKKPDPTGTTSLDVFETLTSSFEARDR